MLHYPFVVELLMYIVIQYLQIFSAYLIIYVI